jgi:hypothetical protein
MRELNRLRVFENRVLRRIFVPKKNNMTGGFRKLNTNELRNFQTTCHQILKPRMMRWDGHVERTKEVRNVRNVCQKIWKEDHLSDLDIDKRMSKCIVKKCDIDE